MKKILKDNLKLYLINILLSAGIYYSSKIYYLTNHATKNLRILQTALDRLIPFIPQFILIYVSLEPVIYVSLIFFLIFYPRVFTAFALAMISLLLISNAVYLVFQTYVPRPSLAPNTSWFIDKVIFLYKRDNPYNCFPSLHCGTSTLTASFWFIKKKYRTLAWIMTFWACGIILSTQFLKQHVLMDITGSLIAMLLFFVFYKIFKLKEEN